MQKLTARQQAVLDFITHSIDERGFPPTLREIGNHLGIRSTNGVNDHLRALERKGYLTREDMKSRTLRPTDRGRFSASPRPGNKSARHSSEAASGGDSRHDSIPVIGSVAAGALTEAIEHPEEDFPLPPSTFPGNGELFGLKVRGDSMIEAGINDRDYVFVRKSDAVRRGEIIVALVGEEATCKYYYPEKDHIRLEPANSEMAPILIPKNDWQHSQVVGRVVGVFRRM